MVLKNVFGVFDACPLGVARHPDSPSLLASGGTASSPGPNSVWSTQDVGPHSALFLLMLRAGCGLQLL